MGNNSFMYIGSHYLGSKQIKYPEQKITITITKKKKVDTKRHFNSLSPAET